MTSPSPAIDIESTAVVAPTAPDAAAAAPEALQLATIAKDTGIEPKTAEGLIASYAPQFATARDLIKQAEECVVTDATQVTEIARSRVLRLKLRELRCDTDDLREKLKADSKRRGDAIQGMWNVFKLLVEPVEEKLMEQEKFAERAEAKRKEELRAYRSTILTPFGVDPALYMLGDMAQPMFDQLVSGMALARDAKIAADAKAEADRIAKEQADAAEAKRIQEENARLKKEADEREAAAKAEQDRLAAVAAEIQRKADEAAAAAKVEADRLSAEKAEIQRKADEAAETARLAKVKAEKDAADALAKQQADAEKETKRIADENAAILAKQKEEADAKAAAVAAEAKRLKDAADEKARKAEADLKALRDAEAAKAAAAAEEQRKAAMAPEKEKLLAFAASIRALKTPDLTTEAGKAAIAKLLPFVEKLAAFVDKEAAAL